LYQIKLFQTQDGLGSSEKLHRSTYSHPFLPFEKILILAVQSRPHTQMEDAVTSAPEMEGSGVSVSSAALL